MRILKVKPNREPMVVRNRLYQATNNNIWPLHFVLALYFLHIDTYLINSLPLSRFDSPLQENLQGI